MSADAKTVFNARGFDFSIRLFVFHFFNRYPVKFSSLSRQRIYRQLRESSLSQVFFSPFHRLHLRRTNISASIVGVDMGPKSKGAKPASDDSSSGSSRPYQRNEESLDDDLSYRIRRDRNNVAVKKSREKSRQKARETADKMARLRQENDELERRTVELANELKTLKNLLLDRAGRRPRSSDTTPSSSASVSASSSQVKVALADPQTVCIDHEYVTTHGACASEEVDDGNGDECLELEESIVTFETGDYYE